MVRTFHLASLAAALLTCMGTVRADDSSGSPLATSHLAALTGEEIYGHLCQACHMPGGQGAVGAGFYPKLAGDPVLKSWQFVVLTVIVGRSGMPGFGLPPATARQLRSASLSDAQIASVVNYVRSHFGNHFKDHVTAVEVAALHPPHAAAR